MSNNAVCRICIGRRFRYWSDIMLCSVLVGLAVMVLGILLLTLMSALYIVPATVSVFCLVWIFAIPLSTAFTAGWRLKHDYLLTSGKSVLLIWFISLILVIWFYPFELSWKLLPITLVVTQIIAVLGSVIGGSFHQALDIYRSSDDGKEE